MAALRPAAPLPMTRTSIFRFSINLSLTEFEFLFHLGYHI
jgi:hypothetical protein